MSQLKKLVEIAETDSTPENIIKAANFCIDFDAKNDDELIQLIAATRRIFIVIFNTNTSIITKNNLHIKSREKFGKRFYELTKQENNVQHFLQSIELTL